MTIGNTRQSYERRATVSKVYVAGEYTDRVQVKEIYRELRECGHTIICDWTDRTNEGITEEDKSAWAVEYMEGVRECDVLIAIVSSPKFIKDHPKLAQLITNFMNPERHQGEVMGAIGGALVMSKPVLLMGAAGYESVMLHHPNVKRVESTKDAIREVNSLSAVFIELLRNSEEARRRVRK